MASPFQDFEDRVNSKLYCNAWVATAIVGSAVVGGAAQWLSSDRAADAQTQASREAAAQQQQMYATTRGDLAPYRALGSQASSEMSTRLSDLTAPISINPNDLENSDYFKFAMTQGQKAVTNSSAARGLGTSGAALKGAAAFAKGLATDTYKTAFDMENTNRTNAYNRLKGLIDVGSTAAGTGGVLGERAAYNTGVATMAGGNAQAAAANAQGGAIRGVTDNIGGYAMYRGGRGMYGDGGGQLGYDTYGGQTIPVYGA